MERDQVEAGLARLMALREEWDAWRGDRHGSYERHADQALDDELIRLFKAFRKALQEAFHLKPGFTYEEFILHVNHSHTIPLSVKEKLVTLAESLNLIEYAEAGTYEEVSRLLDLAIESLQELAQSLPKQKRRRKRKKGKNPFLAMTFLLWGPLALLARKISFTLKRLLAERDPRRLIREELERGRDALRREDIPEAVRAYEALRKAYAQLPEAVKRAVRPEIIEYYNALLDTYEALSGEHVREEVAEEMHTGKVKDEDERDVLEGVKSEAERGDQKETLKKEEEKKSDESKRKGKEKKEEWVEGMEKSNQVDREEAREDQKGEAGRGVAHGKGIHMIGSEVSPSSASSEKGEENERERSEEDKEEAVSRLEALLEDEPSR